MLGESDGDSEGNRIPSDVRSIMKGCAVLVVCVSRGFKTNISCQRIARYAVTQEKRCVLLFALMQGDYTMSSSPEVVNGWLGHMIKGNLALELYSVDALVGYNYNYQSDLFPFLYCRCCNLSMFLQSTIEADSGMYRRCLDIS